MADTTQTLEHAVQVSNISPNANEKTVADFFSFCGKITSLYLNKDEGQETSTAVVQFESESAAKTALLLTNALIVDRPITVVTYGAESTFRHDTATPVTDIPQKDFGTVGDHDRTKTSVVVSMLASGYVLASDAVAKAKEVDEQRGITATVKVGVEQLKVKAHDIDVQYGISEKAASVKQSATDTAKKLNEDYHISEKASAAAQQAKGVASTVTENPNVKAGVATVKSGISSVVSTVSGYVADYKDQTAKAVEEKQAQRSGSISGPSTTTTSEVQSGTTAENPTIIAQPL